MSQSCCPGAEPASAPLSADDEAAAKLFKALGDPVRLAMLAALAAAGREAICACDFVAVTAKAQPTVSHHLKVLREAGLVEAERRGTWVWYRLVPSRLEEARDLLVLDRSPTSV